MPISLPQPARTLPKDPHIDSTLGLLTDGYEFICKRARALDTDAFAARLPSRRRNPSAAGCPAKMRRLK